MTEERKHRGNQAAAGAGAGVFWFIGWLFTIAYADLIWWKMILGLVIWPYYLGLALR